MHRTAPTRTRRGFTLVELLGVMTVIFLLAGTAAYGYSSLQRDVRSSSAKDMLRTIAAAQQMHYNSRGTFVASTSAAPVSTAQLEEVAKNPQGYTDHDVEPTTAMQVSVAQGTGYGSVPAVGLATTVRGGACVVLVTFPTEVRRDNLEGTFKRGDYTKCTGDEAFALLDAGSAPAGEHLPEQVHDLSATSGASSVSLTWAQAANADGYRIFRQGPGEATFTPVQENISATTYTDLGLDVTHGTDPASYTYYVVGYNSHGTGAASSQVTATPGAAAVADVGAPTDVTAAVTAADTIKVSWTAAKNSVAYRVLRDSGNGYDPVAYLSGDTLTTDYSDNGTPGHTYTYKVVAYSAGGSLRTSSPATATTPPVAPASVNVTLPDVSPANPGACDPRLCVKLTWTASADPTGAGAAPVTAYRLYRCMVGNGCPATDVDYTSTYALVGSVPAGARTYTDTGLEAGDYKYAVAAVNAGGASIAGRVATASTGPGVVQGVSVDAPTAATPGLLGLPLSVATAGYRMWVQAADGTWSPHADTLDAGATSWTLQGVSATQRVHRFRVQGLNASGGGMLSPVVAARPLPATPNFTSAAVTGTDSDRVALRWDTVETVTYDLFKNGSLFRSDIAAGVYTDVLGNDTAASYYLRATNLDGRAVIGNTVSVTTPPTPPAKPVTVTSTGTSGGAYTTVLSGLETSSAGANFWIYSCAPGAAGGVCTNPSFLGSTSTSTFTRGPYPLSTTGFPQAGKTYYYAVAVRASSGQLSVMSPLLVSRMVPAAPRNVTAAYAGTSLNLSWDSDPQADEFRIKSADGSVTLDVANNTAGPRTHAVISDVAAATHKAATLWKIAAFNADTDSLADLNRYFEVPAPGANLGPLSTTSLRATQDGGSVNLTWYAPGARYYKVVRCTGAGCDPRTSGTAQPADAGTDAGSGGWEQPVATGSTYTYAVATSADNLTWSNFSAPVTFTATTPAPTNLQVTARASDSLDISWTPAASGTGYKVYRDGVLISTVSGLSTSSYKFTSLAEGTKYSLGLRTTGPDGDSAMAFVVTKTVALPPMAAATGLSATATGPTQATFTWDPVPGATSYSVWEKFCASLTGCEASWTVSSTTTTSFTIDEGRKNGQYQFNVTGNDGQGRSGPLAGIVKVNTIPTLEYPQTSLSVAYVGNNCYPSWCEWVGFDIKSSAQSWTLERSMDGGPFTPWVNSAGTSQLTYSGAGTYWAGSQTDGTKWPHIGHDYVYRLQGCNSAGCTDWYQAPSTRVPYWTDVQRVPRMFWHRMMPNTTGGTTDYSWVTYSPTGATFPTYFTTGECPSFRSCAGTDKSVLFLNPSNTTGFASRSGSFSANSPNPGSNSARTWEFAYKQSGTWRGNAVLAYQQGSATANSWMLYTDATATNRLRWANGTQFSGLSQINDGQWHLYDIVYNGTAVTLYEDGVSLGTITVAVNTTATAPARLGGGGASIGVSGTPSTGARGWYDEWSVTGSALSAADVLEHFNGRADGD